MSDKWVQAALVIGLCLGIQLGSWIAIIFDPYILFMSSYLLVIPSIYLTARARGSRGVDK